MDYSPKKAKQFKIHLFQSIKRISKNPYKCRKSIYFDDDQIRDMIFQKHTIVYKIEDNKIVIFGFLKHQQFPIDQKN